MNLARYAELKAKGAITLIKVGPATVAVATQRFDPNTGKEIEAELEQFNLQKIDDTIAELSSQVKALQTFRDDAAGLLAGTAAAAA